MVTAVAELADRRQQLMTEGTKLFCRLGARTVRRHVKETKGRRARTAPLPGQETAAVAFTTAQVRKPNVLWTHETIRKQSEANQGDDTGATVRDGQVAASGLAVCEAP